MFRILLFLTLCSSSLNFVICIDVKEKMEAECVVPDVIKNAPNDILEVRFSSGVEANLGNELTPTQVKDIPKVSWKAVPDAFYTLCFTDPDVPSRKSPSLREAQHWLVVNIMGNNVSKGTTLTEYVGSGSPKGTGLHRYVFLVYEQPAEVGFKEPYLTNRSVNGRINFSIIEFAKKYNLSGPVAGNFYQAKWDPYVPKLHEQIGI